jgi:hypothetical protein
LLASARGLSHLLVAPQGFTLSIAGTLAISVQRHAPDAFAIWMFVLGGGLAFCATALTVGALRETMTLPVNFVGLALLNLVPVGVVPLAAVAGWWIHRDSAAMFVSGAVAVIAYVWGLAGFLALTRRRR